MKSMFDNPLVAAVTAWLVLGFCTLAFKPRTPESYAALALRKPVWFFARFAAFWQFVGALGIDPAKVAEGLSKVVTGHVKPLTVGTVAADRKTDDESGPYSNGMLPIAACLIGALSLLGVAPILAACSSTPQTPAETTRQKQLAAEGSYDVQMHECIDKTKYPKRADAEACLDGVRKQWHRLPDGGADPAFNHDEGAQ